MEKSLQSTLPSVRPRTECVIPDWLRHYADAWREAGALAVVLYGSRAFGTALPDSDWDIAVVLDKRDDTAYTEPNIDSEITQHYEVNRVIGDRSRFAPSFAREVRKGVSLVGDIRSLFPELDPKDLERIKKSDFTLHLCWVLVKSTEALCAINSRSRSGCEKDLSLVSSLGGIESSSYAAKRCIKAVCCLLDIGYEHSRDLDALVEKLPDEWGELVTRMNEIGLGRSVVYDPIEQEQESCQVTIGRVVCTLDLVERLMLDDLMSLTEEGRERLVNSANNAGSIVAYLSMLGKTDTLAICSTQAHRIAVLLGLPPNDHGSGFS